MSILIKTVLTKINKKLNGCRFEGSIKIEIYDEGSIFINEDGASTIDTKVDCIMSSDCLLYTSPSPRDRTRSRMPSSA